MKLTNLSLIAFAILLLITACRNAAEKLLDADRPYNLEEIRAMAPPETDETEVVRKHVIRRSEMRIRVKDVKKSITQLEQMAVRMGGYVENTNLESSEIRSLTKTLTKDSVLRVMKYAVDGSITLRIPVTVFDSAVNVIQRTAVFVSYRKTFADDVTLQYLANRQKSEIYSKAGSRIQNASGKANKLEDITNAEQVASDFALSSADKRTANLELQQRVNFSSIQVDLYQPGEVFMERILNTDISDYQPSFGYRLADAAGTGWKGMVTFLLFLVRIWPLLVLITIACLLFFRRYNLIRLVRKG